MTQRGVNRCAIFVDDDDRHHFRRLLREACRKHDDAIHAFVLMDNHVHLLLGATRSGSVSSAMRLAGQSYVQAFNHRHGRSGTLWQGRFKSSLADSDHYLLTVMRYIELNPVRAAMVDVPEAYRWSSVHTHLGQARDPMLTPHPIYLASGENTDLRAAAYRSWLYAPLAPEDLAAKVFARLQMRTIPINVSASVTAGHTASLAITRLLRAIDCVNRDRRRLNASTAWCSLDRSHQLHFIWEPHACRYKKPRSQLRSDWL